MTTLSYDDRKILIERCREYTSEELIHFTNGFLFAKTGREPDGIQDYFHELSDADLLCLARYLTENYYSNEFDGLSVSAQWETIQGWEVTDSVGKEAWLQYGYIPNATCLLELHKKGFQIMGDAGVSPASFYELARHCKCAKCVALKATR